VLKKILCVFLCAILLAVGMNLSPLLRLILHEIVNIFAGGRSLAKVYAFLLYVCLLVLAASLPVKKGINLPAPKWRRWLVIFLMLGFFLNLCSFLAFTYTNRLRLFDTFLINSNSELSSTSLFHNHVLKGMLGKWLSLFNVTNLENSDPGLVFANMFPNAFWLVISLVICIVGILFILHFRSLIDPDSTTGSWLSAMILYAILSFSLLKNLIDGGIGNEEAVISLALWFGIYYPHYRWKTVAISAGLFLYLCIQIWLNSINSSLPLQTQLYSSIAIIFHWLLLVFILLPFWYTSQQKTYNRLTLLLVTLALLACVHQIQRGWNLYAYEQTVLTSDAGAIIALYHDPGDADYQLLYALGPLNFYRFFPDQPTRIAMVLDQQQVIANFYPIAIPWESCFPTGTTDTYTFLLQTKKPLPTNKYADAVVELNAQPVTQTDGQYTYQASLAIQPCHPRTVNIIQESIRRLGNDSFVIINIAYQGP